MGEIDRHQCVIHALAVVLLTGAIAGWSQVSAGGPLMPRVISLAGGGDTDLVTGAINASSTLPLAILCETHQTDGSSSSPVWVPSTTAALSRVDAEDSAAVGTPPAEREFLQGRFYVSMNEDDAALAHLSKSIQLDPKSAKAYVARGELHLARRNRRQALQDFSRAVELEPQSASAHTAVGRCHLANKEWTKAIAELSKAITLNPGEYSAYAARGFAYLNTGDYVKAITDKDSAIRLIGRENEEMRRAVEPYLQKYRSPLQKDRLTVPPNMPDDRINTPPPEYRLLFPEAIERAMLMDARTPNEQFRQLEQIGPIELQGPTKVEDLVPPVRQEPPPDHKPAP